MSPIESAVKESASAEEIPMGEASREPLSPENPKNLDCTAGGSREENPEQRAHR